MAITGLHHVVIRVNDLDEAIESYTKLGLELTKTLETPGIGKQAVFRFPNGTFLELVAPTDPDSPVGKAIASRGEGVHTISIEMKDFEDSVSTLADNGTRLIRSEDLPNVAFVHPKETHGVLLQLNRENS
ncbi:MAG: VOC family protein [Candidatus Hydrogenedentota bacterium]